MFTKSMIGEMYKIVVIDGIPHLVLSKMIKPTPMSFLSGMYEVVDIVDTEGKFSIVDKEESKCLK
jgi:hypothetical protein